MKGLRSLLLVGVLALSGCVFNKGNERVSFGMIGGAGVGAGGFKHDIYHTGAREKVKCAFDSDLSISAWSGEGQFEMKIHGEDRKGLWKYKVYTKREGDRNKVLKTEIYGADGDVMKTIYGGFRLIFR